MTISKKYGTALKYFIGFSIGKQIGDCLPNQLLHVSGTGRQRNREIRGIGNVVESDDRNIFRNPDLIGKKKFFRAKSNAVIIAEDCGFIGPFQQHLTCIRHVACPLSELIVPVAVQYMNGRKIKTVFRKRPQQAGHSPHVI